jgi:hypothetical protein
MRKLFLIFALAGGPALAQLPTLPEPSPPMVPAVTPAMGAASRATRHEVFARERELRVREKAEDRADAELRRKATDRALRRTER